MIKAVIDTNALVAALLSPAGSPAQILDHIINGNVLICYDSSIIEEYHAALLRPKFGFESKAIRHIIDYTTRSGISIVPVPLPVVIFADDGDKKFYEVARTAEAYLVTGNIKHFTKEPFIKSPREFLMDMSGM
jgi:uncharacterized protein